MVDVTPQGTRVETLGATWDQIAARRLEGGDHVRILIEEHGNRLLIQFGAVPADHPDIIEWKWESMLSPVDAAAVIGMTSAGQARAAVNTALFVKQMRANADSLEGKVLSLARQLKEAKDGPTPTPTTP